MKESVESKDESKRLEEDSEKVRKPNMLFFFHKKIGVDFAHFLAEVIYRKFVYQVKDTSDNVKVDEDVKPDDKPKTTEDQNKMEATDGKYSLR